MRNFILTLLCFMFFTGLKSQNKLDVLIADETTFKEAKSGGILVSTSNEEIYNLLRVKYKKEAVKHTAKREGERWVFVDATFYYDSTMKTKVINYLKSL